MLDQVVTFDLETTGLNPAGARIIEIAAVRWVRGRIMASFHSLVNPHGPIPPESAAVHGIRDEDVAGAPDVSFALQAFESFREDLPLVAHNASFDLRFLAAESARISMALRTARVIDTLALARAAFPAQPSFKLERLSTALNLEATGYHRATADAITAGKLFWRGVEALGQVPQNLVRNWAPPIQVVPEQVLDTAATAALA